MRQFNLLFIVAFLSLVLFSCSSDDDSSGSTNEENQPPNAFSLVSVSAGATDVNLKPGLVWEPAQDNDSESVTYDVVIGTENPPENVIASNLATTTYKLQNELDYSTEYFWKIVAKDNDDNSTSSSVSSFTTRKNTNFNLIQGRWYYDKVDGEDYDSCFKKGYYEFDGDEDFINSIGEGKLVQYDDDSGECQEVGRFDIEYDFNGNDVLEIEYYDDSFDPFDTDEFVITFLTEDKLIFKREFSDGDSYTIEFRR